MKLGPACCSETTGQVNKVGNIKALRQGDGRKYQLPCTKKGISYNLSKMPMITVLPKFNPL
jgi:hypothetical protein